MSVFKKVRELQEAYPEYPLYLGGTFVLNKLKVLSTEPEDIDIFVYAPAYKKNSIYATAETLFGAGTKSGGYSIQSVYYETRFNAKINLVVKDISHKQFSDSGFTYKEIKVIPIEIILLAKHRYNRLKDWKHKFNMLFNILIPTRISKLVEHLNF
jgi:hypothetical protein